MTDEIQHEGTIEQISGDHIIVRIAQTSACLHCKVAGYCSSSESKEKLIDIWTRRASRYAVGQKVNVVMGGRLGLKAVFLAFVVPVIIACIVIAAILWATAPAGPMPLSEPYNQGAAAIGGLLTFAVYYVILYFFRSNLQQKFQFQIAD